MLGFHSLQPCSNEEETIVPQVIDSPIDDETSVNDLVGLHHTLGFDFMPPHSILEEDVVLEDIEHFLEDFSLPTFLFQE